MARKKAVPAEEERLVAYYRYSEGSKQTEQSIEGQRRDCQAWAKSHGLTISHEYIDRHISGKTDNRAQFQLMMEDSDRQAFDILICWKTDRLSRNRYDSAIYKSRLRKNGVKIVYAAETSVDGPEGIILEGLMESLAEYYSAELSQKLRRGMRESAMKGHSLGGHLALGLTTNKAHEFIIDEAQAPTVRYIFEQYAAGQTAAEIVSALNANGKLTAHGGAFNKNSVLRIVTNEQYIGTYTSEAYGVRLENVIPPIIDRALWDKVQAKVAFNRAGRSPRSRRANYMLSGKLFCGLCGCSMRGVSGTGRHGDKHYYYSCGNHRQCGKKNIDKGFLENMIASATAFYVLSPGNMDQIIDRIMEIQKNDIRLENPEKEMLTAELGENTRRQDNILRAIEDGTASSKLAARLTDLESREIAIRSRLRELEVPPAPTYSREQLLFMLSQFQRSPDEQDEAYKERLLNTFVRAVYLTDDSALIKFNITSSDKEESTMLESMMLDLLTGKPISSTHCAATDCKWFDRVALGTPSATPDEPFQAFVAVFPTTFFLCIHNIMISKKH